MKRQQRNNIAARPDGAEFEYLKDEVARRLIDRLEDVDREFPFALDLGCGSGHIYKQLGDEEGLGGVKELIQCDSAGACVLLHAKWFSLARPRIDIVFALYGLPLHRETSVPRFQERRERGAEQHAYVYLRLYELCD